MNLVNKDNFKDIINKDASLICFGASWCGKCQMAMNKFPDYEKALNGLVQIYKIDADESREIFDEYNVDHMPIFILFKNGKELARRSALATPDGLLDFVKTSLEAK